MFGTLLAVALTNRDILLVVLAVVAGVGVMSFFSTDVHKLIEFRRKAKDTEKDLVNIGLPHSGAFFGDLAIGDVEGAWREGHAARVIMQDPVLRAAALQNVINKYVLNAAIATPQELARLQTMINALAPLAAVIQPDMAQVNKIVTDSAATVAAAQAAAAAGATKTA